MAQPTLEKLQDQHVKDMDINRALGVVEYKSGEKQSDRVYEVVEGCKGLPGGIRIGPGARFHPTEAQVKNGSLRGKARELTATEYGSVRRHERPPVSNGADFGEMAEGAEAERVAKLSDLPMADTTLKAAIDGGLTVLDFQGIEPGFEDRYTGSQVRELVAGKSPQEHEG